jgi:hypothetical protein
MALPKYVTEELQSLRNKIGRLEGSLNRAYDSMGDAQENFQTCFDFIMNVAAGKVSDPQAEARKIVEVFNPGSYEDAGDQP